MIDLSGPGPFRPHVPLTTLRRWCAVTPASRAAALAFLTAFVTLFMQVLVHRMVSAKLLNNYAFLVISLTMLGFAGSGVLLALTLPRLMSRLNDWIVVFASLFAMTAIGVAALFYQADLGAQGAVSRSDFLWKLLRWAPLSLVFAVPFTFCGMIIGLLLSARGLPVRRIYCADLLGSAAGAVSVLPAIALMGVEWCTVLICAVLLVGVGLLATPTRPHTQ